MRRGLVERVVGIVRIGGLRRRSRICRIASSTAMRTITTSLVHGRRTRADRFRRSALRRDRCRTRDRERLRGLRERRSAAAPSVTLFAAIMKRVRSRDRELKVLLSVDPDTACRQRDQSGVFEDAFDPTIPYVTVHAKSAWCASKSWRRCILDCYWYIGAPRCDSRCRMRHRSLDNLAICDLGAAHRLRPERRQPRCSEPDPRAMETPQLTESLFKTMHEAGAKAGVGRYNEARVLYCDACCSDPGTRPTSTGPSISAWIFSPKPGTPVCAPLAWHGARVSNNDAAARLRARCSILRHENPDGSIRFSRCTATEPGFSRGSVHRPAHRARPADRDGRQSGPRMATGRRICIFKSSRICWISIAIFPALRSRASASVWLSLSPDPNRACRDSAHDSRARSPRKPKPCIAAMLCSAET